MQRSFIQTTQAIKNLPYGIGDKIWNFYFQKYSNQQQNHKDLIDEFKNLIQSTKPNIDYDKFKKHKNLVSSALQKKKHSVKLPFPSRFHPEHSKYSSLISKTNAKFINSLDIFVGDLEEKLLVFTLAYKNRFLVKYEYPSRYQYVWKNCPKKNFIIKYLLYTYSQEYWMDNTCNGTIKKSGKRCSCWLKPNLTRCAKHKFK